MFMHKKTGVLLINLGTPDAATEPAIRHYLDEFLMDPYVVDIPWPLRAILVKGIILRTRPKQSAKAYQKIWTEQGSPLLIHSQAFADALNNTTDEDVVIELGMRYGNPSINSALQRLMDPSIEKLIVWPLFPQYSRAATESAIQAFHNSYKQLNCVIPFRIVRDFYNEPAFIQPQTALIQAAITEQTDAVLLSYHGLPTKQLSKAGCQHVKSDCLQHTACPAIDPSNQDCYRAQCYATSRAIADALIFDRKKIVTAFQSRLGKTPWIKPYTDEMLVELYEQGMRHLVVACPSFVADCLETLEEMDIRARDQWKQLGGKSFILAPCLNSCSAWIQNAATFQKQVSVCCI